VLGPGVAGSSGTGGSGGFGAPDRDGTDGSSTSGPVGTQALGGGVIRGTVADSIVVANTGPQCLSLNSQASVAGHNVDSDGSCGGITANPQLGPLADHGGPTFTFALPAGSPALGEVPASGASCPDSDQRGVLRPQGTRCDAGAYERAPPTVVSESATNVTRTGARLGARVNPHRLAAQVHFVWNRPGQSKHSTPTTALAAGLADTSVSATLTGLAPGTSYVYQVVITSVDGTTKGAQQTFTTGP
jgi:hypothetical protein